MYLYFSVDNQAIVGRLLTPQEGCGTPGKRGMKRVVGGSVAKNGKLLQRVRGTGFVEPFSNVWTC